MAGINKAILGITDDFKLSQAEMDNMYIRLSAESDNSIDIGVIFKVSLPNYAASLVDSVTSLASNMGKVLTFSEENSAPTEVNLDTIKILQDDYLNKESAYNFTAISNTVVSIPENFAGSMLDYLHLMTKTSDIDSGLYKATLALLREYNAFLSVFITNRDARGHYSIAEPIYKIAEKEHAEIKKEMQKYFVTNTGKSKARLGAIFDRMADLRESFTYMKKLCINYNTAPIHEIKSESDKCAELLKLITVGNSSIDTSVVSKETAKKLANGVYILGRLIEIISVHRFQHQVVMNSSVNMHKQLHKTMS